MSHKATNWAVNVRGISATAKVVLWHLADRHNKDTGRCDPSQAQLSKDCEISRSTLNAQLKMLEGAGLISRKQRTDSDTKRQKTTFYILNFDANKPQDMPTRVRISDMEAVSDLEADPCPISGQSRVRISDTNPVSEPGIEPCAAESAADESFEIFFEAHPRPIRKEKTWEAYIEALEVGVDPSWLLSSARAYAVEQHGNKTRFVKSSVEWLKESRWQDFPFSKPDDLGALRERLVLMMSSTSPAVRQAARDKWEKAFPGEPVSTLEAAE